MKTVFCVLASATLTACSSMPTSRPKVSPRSTLTIEQATMRSPDEADWVVIDNQIHSLVLARASADQKQTTLLSAVMFAAGTHPTARAFLDFIAAQRLKQDDQTRFKVLSSKTALVTFKDLPCLKYQTLSEDHQDQGIGSAKFEYFKTNGYVCRYPLEYIAFQFEISHRSPDKQIPAERLDTARTFFDAIELNPATIQRLKNIP